jgi:hypothetical protein
MHDDSITALQPLTGWPGARACARFLCGFSMLACSIGLAAIPAGCTDGGQVSIRFILPTDAALSPVDKRLAGITLVTRSADGRAEEHRDVIDPADGLDLGFLTAGDEVELAVELRSPTQRLIGYGRTAGTIEVVAGQDLDVPIQVRRPFVYLGGDTSELAVFDATLDPTTSYAGGIALAAPRASAATLDGAELVVVSEAGGAGRLQLVSTSDHQITGEAVALSKPPRDVAVSPDGRFAVVAHDQTDGGVSVVDLDAVRAGGNPTARFLDLGAVGAVAAASDGRGFALVDRDAGYGCSATAPASTVAVFALDGGDASTLPTGGAMQDFAVAADGSQVMLADPCKDRLARLHPDSGVVEDAVELPGASAVAINRDRVVGAGVAPVTASLGRRVTVVSAALDGNNASRLELAPAQERIQSIEFSGSDQKVEVAIDADQLRPFELAALPGSDLVALVTEAYYHADESGDFLGSPVVPEMEITAFEYLLIDASTRTVVQRLRTYCDGFLLSDAVLSEFECSSAPDQDTLPFEDSYQPTQVSVLYGGR